MKKLIKYFFIAMLLLVITETTIRLTLYGRLRENHLPEYVLDSIAGYVYKPNRSHLIKNSAFINTFISNSLGYNWKEFSKEKPKDVFRIILLGTSEETGVYTDGPNNFVKCTQELFDQSGMNVEIQNWTIDGKFSDLRRLRVIKKRCVEYNPDLILYRVSLPLVHSSIQRMTYKGYTIRFSGSISSTMESRDFVDKYLTRKSIFTVTYDILYSYRLFVRYCSYNEVFMYDGNKSFFKKYLHPIMRCFLPNKRVVESYVSKIVYNSNDESSQMEFSVAESINMYKEVSEWLAEKGIKFALFNTYSKSNDAIYETILNYIGIDYVTPRIIHQSKYNFGELDGHSNQIGHQAIADGFYHVLRRYCFDSSGVKKRLDLSTCISSNSSLTEKNISNDQKPLPLKRHKSDTCKILIICNSDYYKKHLNKTVNTLFSISEDKVKLSFKQYNGQYPIFSFFEDSLLRLQKEYNYNIILVDIPLNLAFMHPRKYFNTMKENSLAMNKYNCKLVHYGIQDNVGNTTIPLVEFLSKSNGISFIKKQINTPPWVLKKYGKREYAIAHSLLMGEFLYDRIRSELLDEEYISPLSNLSRNKNVSSNGFKRGNFTNYNAIDGNRFDDEIKFIRYWPWASGNDSTSEKRITIDLDSTYQISKLVIYPLSNGTRYPSRFSLFISNDSLHWDAVSLSKNKSHIYFSNRTPLNYSFSETPARYVKFVAPKTRISEKYVNEKYVASFNEIEVYGR